ncbi:MAG: hypothetical protein LBG49_02140 [Mycoplasmataceae bacterium]|nr:hypothetical protein [Mycoplasmataceae bacterium]
MVGSCTFSLVASLQLTLFQSAPSINWTVMVTPLLIVPVKEAAIAGCYLLLQLVVSAGIVAIVPAPSNAKEAL